MKKPNLHLICNAHLDPVWQWRWEEGCAEALATFQNAVVLLDEHRDLVFNHNEALLYRWVEHHDPALFREIRCLVEQERWFISGGWYLQPDANLPGLEAFFRHIQQGRRYFLDRFGRQPRVAYNFDAFGHHGGLPQILRLTGYDMYIHMRPQQEELELPSDLYRWQGVDGSEVLALRIAVGLYHTERDNIEERLESGAALALKLNRDLPVFWGLGNHGGGATREDLEKIDAFIRGEERVTVIHSTPDRLYESLRDAALEAPVVQGDLQRTFTGCYTSLARIKRRARKSLARLVQAEAISTAAWWWKGERYPESDLDEAWRDHLFNDFHDILPGTCTEPAEQDALDLYGRAAETARRVRFAAMAAFNRGAGPGPSLPVTVMNTNPALTTVPIEVEFMADYRPFQEPRKMAACTLDGEKILSQEEKPEALLPFNDWRRKVCFMARLPGTGAARFRLEAHGEEDEPEAHGPAVDCDVDARTGMVTRIQTREGVSCLDGGLFKPLVMEDKGDSWGTGCHAYRDALAAFEPEEVRVIQKGPVRTITESTHAYGHSRIVMHVITYTSWPVIEVRMRISWFERQKMLKIAVPTSFRTGELSCEIPGGFISRPGDGQEHVHGRWLMIHGPEKANSAALGIVNSGQHGLDLRNGELRLSVLRSAAYCHERGMALSGRERKFMDQGIHNIRLLACAGKPDGLRKRLTGLADWLDTPPLAYAHLPVGSIGKSGSTEGPPVQVRSTEELLAISDPSIRMTSFNRSQDGNALIIRLHETTGGSHRVILQLSGKSPDMALSFNPFEIKTLRIERNGSWREVNPCDPSC